MRRDYRLPAGAPARIVPTIILLFVLTSIGPASWAPPLRVLAVPALQPATAPADDSSPPIPYSSAPDYLDAGLQAVLDDAVSDAPGDWAVSVKKLDTGQYAAVNAHTQAVTASLYKLFVLYEVMHERLLGELSLDDTKTITDADAAYDESIGALNWNIGDQATIARLINRMITVSDNTAAAALVDVVGPDNINDSLQRLGLADSSINWNGGDNLTTASDYMHLLEMIATGQVLDRDSCRYILNVLLQQQINPWLPQGLPDGVPFAHKTGTLDGLIHDAGIVYGPSGPYIITAMSWNLDSEGTADAVMPQLSQAVYRYFNNHTFQPARYFPETHQIVGPAFLLFYNTHGGQSMLGLPIGPELQQGNRIIQYFERARLERPAAGGPVSLGNIGTELIQAEGRSFDPTSRADPHDTNTQWFAESQQAIGQPFLNYWREHGDSEMFGLPISNIVIEQQNGHAVRVQYFQRARFELHGDTIQLGRIGSELLQLAR